MLKVVLERFLDDLQETGPGEYLTICPLHDDDKPSLSVNIAKKLFFCHACQAKGSTDELLSKMLNLPLPMIRWELDQLVDWAPPKFDVQRFHSKLLASPKQLDYLKEKRLWSEEVIRKLKIGYDGNRVTIPVFNVFGMLVNVRAYKPGADKDEPKVINLKGYGKARLYKGSILSTNNDIYICEGEPDAICGYSMGLSTVSSTAGAGKFDPIWSTFFAGKRVRILYDLDEAGSRGASKVAEFVSRHAKEVKVLWLPLDGGTDLTDYYIQGGTTQGIEELEEVTDPEIASFSEEPVVDSTVYEVSLYESSQERYYKKRVEMEVMVSGKMLSPYLIPKKVKVHCSQPGLNMCKGCILHLEAGEKRLEFDGAKDTTLQLIETPTDNHIRIFKRIVGIPPKCQVVQYDVEEAQNVEEAKVIPALDFSIDDSRYVIRQIFYLGHGLEPNTTYKVKGLTIPHPKSQQVTYLIEEIQSLEDTITTFEMTEELAEQLRIFQVNEADQTKT